MRTFGWLLLAGATLTAVSTAAQAPSSTTSATQGPVSAVPQAPASTPAAPRIVGTMSELMVDVIYPTSDAILYITTRTPKDERGWIELQGQALMLAEAGNLLMMPGRARDERWMDDAKLMRDAGAAAFRAAKAKDVDALAELNEAVYVSCTTCHMHYRTNYGRGRQTQPPAAPPAR